MANCYPCDEDHSGLGFDWWRCSKQGRIVTVRKRTPPLILPEPEPPRYTGDLCWPLKGQFSTADRKEDVSSQTCEVGREFWPDKGDRSGKQPRLEHARPPWVPTQLPNQWGVVKYPPPYTRYCRDRETPIQFVTKL